MNINPYSLAAQLSALRLIYPDLAEDEEAWALSIESETEVHEVLREIERRRRSAKAMNAALDIEIDQLCARRTRFGRRAEAMRELALRIMEMANVRKIDTPEATFSISRGHSRVVITDEDALPDSVCKITRSPDKTKIKELLTIGAPVHGAALSNAEPHLTIRTR